MLPEIRFQARELSLEHLVFRLHKLQFFLQMRQNLNGGRCFLPQLQQLLIPLFNLLILALIFDFQLFEINHVQFARHFLPPLDRLFQLLALVPQLQVGLQASE